MTFSEIFAAIVAGAHIAFVAPTLHVALGCEILLGLGIGLGQFALRELN